MIGPRTTPAGLRRKLISCLARKRPIGGQPVTNGAKSGLELGHIGLPGSRLKFSPHKKPIGEGIRELRQLQNIGSFIRQKSGDLSNETPSVGAGKFQDHWRFVGGDLHKSRSRKVKEYPATKNFLVGIRKRVAGGDKDPPSSSNGVDGDFPRTLIFAHRAILFQHAGRKLNL